MRTRALPALALLLALASGCAVGPEYRRPQVEPPAAFRGQDQADPASLADQPWWQVFADADLKALIDQALAGNFDVQAAAQRVEEYRARAGMERADYLPTLTPGAGWTRGRNSGYTTGGGSTGSVFNVQATLNWELDLWGRLRRLNEAARARYLGTLEARRGVCLATVAQVAQAWFELRDLDTRLAIAKDSVADYQATLELFNRRLQAGAASALETSRAQAALATAQASVPDLERQIAAQENLISLLLGRGPGPVPRSGDPAAADLPPAIPAGLPSALLERRPDLRRAEQDLVAANAAVGVAQAAWFPTFTLTSVLGGIAPELNQLFGKGKEWEINPALNGPSIQGLRLRDQKAVAVAQWQQARTQYQAAVTGAFGEVATLLTAYRKLAEQEQAQAQAVAANREAVRLATLRYDTGLSSYLDVLDAQQQLYPARDALAAVRLARQATLVGLYKALGGGWNLEDPGKAGGWAAPKG
jgi:multidrug efflux system outer membrane protein